MTRLSAGPTYALGLQSGQGDISHHNTQFTGNTLDEIVQRPRRRQQGRLVRHCVRRARINSQGLRRTLNINLPPVLPPSQSKGYYLATANV